MKDKYLLLRELSGEQYQTVCSVKSHCERLLDCAPRFKYFTLHGRQHIENLFEISNILLRGGVELNQDESFLLALAICLHDIGMVTPMSALEEYEIFEDKTKANDLANLEMLIRNNHHQLIEEYVDNRSSFFSSLNISPALMAMIQDICKGHRVVNLEEQFGYAKELGALLRVIDELDMGPRRAPADVLENFYTEMGGTSCWHWYKHAITQDWLPRDNVSYEKRDGKNFIIFKLVVRPASRNSVNYWMKQSLRPIYRVLKDESSQRIIESRWNVVIDVMPDYSRSKPITLGKWEDIESLALSSGKKTVLLIDDEYRKMQDMFLGLMDDYHIVYSHDAKHAMTRLKAGSVDLAIVDMQVGTGGMWSAEETNYGKATGIKICEEISKGYPETKIGVLTGTRYSIEELDKTNLAFFMKKPIDQDEFEERVKDVLQ